MMKGVAGMTEGVSWRRIVGATGRSPLQGRKGFGWMGNGLPLSREQELCKGLCRGGREKMDSGFRRNDEVVQRFALRGKMGWGR